MDKSSGDTDLDDILDIMQPFGADLQRANLQRAMKTEVPKDSQRCSSSRMPFASEAAFRVLTEDKRNGLAVRPALAVRPEVALQSAPQSPCSRLAVPCRSPHAAQQNESRKRRINDDAVATVLFQQHFLDSLPRHARVRRAEAIARTLVASDADWLECAFLPSWSSTQACKIGAHCVGDIQQMTELSCQYKLGVTTDPRHRWHMALGYKQQRFSKMVLFWASASKEAIDMLEYAMISRFKAEEGCLNVAPGGEGPLESEPPHFFYMAWKFV